MGMAAEPTPAELPLEGGIEGATVKLHPLLAGTSIAPEAWFFREQGRLAKLRALGFRTPKEEWLRIPIVCFLVEHPGLGPFLIDTGLHPSVAVDPRQNLGRIGARFFQRLEMEPEQATPGQLRARELDPAAIRLVLMTHLHADHASAVSEFPHAAFFVSKREWEAATAHGGLRAALRGYRRRQFDHAFDYRLLDFDSPQADSFATFGRALDIFGDGSVRAVYTPGHTLGHVSYVLRLRGRREALIAGDAIYAMRTLADSHPPIRMADEHEFRRSLREIQLYAEQTPDALIVPGHDLERWRQLAPVYE